MKIKILKKNQKRKLSQIEENIEYISTTASSNFKTSEEELISNSKS